MSGSRITDLTATTTTTASDLIPIVQSSANRKITFVNFTSVFSDGSGNVSVDVNNRRLKSANGSVALDWNSTNQWSYVVTSMAL